MALPSPSGDVRGGEKGGGDVAITRILKTAVERA
jgi:hypothetical protein